MQVILIQLCWIVKSVSIDFLLVGNIHRKYMKSSICILGSSCMELRIRSTRYFPVYSIIKTPQNRGQRCGFPNVNCFHLLSNDDVYIYILFGGLFEKTCAAQDRHISISFRNTIMNPICIIMYHTTECTNVLPISSTNEQNEWPTFSNTCIYIGKCICLNDKHDCQIIWKHRSWYPCISNRFKMQCQIFVECISLSWKHSLQYTAKQYLATELSLWFIAYRTCYEQYIK